MSQKTITSFFTSRKRPATNDIFISKSKIAKSLVDDLSLASSKSVSNANENTKVSDVINPSKKLTHSFVEDERDTATAAQITVQLEAHEKSAIGLTKKSNVCNIKSQNQSKSGGSNPVNLARKELNLGDLRKRLANSSRLAQIKASADRISKSIQELKEDGDIKKNLKQFKSIDVEVPISPSKNKLLLHEQTSKQSEINASSEIEKPLISPRKVIVSPVKSPSKVPAYLKHASLATSVTSLPLPHKYRFLAEIFRGMETVVALLTNRNEKITFAKLKPSVQEMLKRNFTEKHLAQIKHLVPDFYTFEVRKINNFSTSIHKDSFELVITPNFPNEIKIMNPSVLLERRRFFYETLLQLVKKYHAQYLLTIDPPMVIPNDKLTRWHPEFELENVPDVNCGKLPELPNTEKLSNAQDVLAKARELFKCNTKMERALEKLTQAKARGLTDEEKLATGLSDIDQDKEINTKSETSQANISGVTILNPALRNLPAALLEKVKAKQAAKALEAMTRSSEDEKKYMIYTRLPDLARTLRNIYVTERKNVLALNIILSKLNVSFKSSINSSDLQNDIKLLAEEVPEWIKLHNLRNTTYLKLDKNADLKNILTKLEALVKNYKIAV
ncbi:hypothetical protein ACJJTC_003682 [Scirpophaga incertulas]